MVKDGVVADESEEEKGKEQARGGRRGGGGYSTRCKKCEECFI